MDRVTRTLKAAILAEGVEGVDVLDLGCGTGDIARGLVLAGARRATGIDLSPGAVARAQLLAAEDGVGERTTFLAGNAATASLDQHDLVVLDKVICCFADLSQLLANSVPAARSAYAFSMPRSDGAWGPWARVAIAIENANHWAHRRGFRAYAHDARAVHAALEAAGFRLRQRRTSFGWLCAVYTRDPHP